MKKIEYMTPNMEIVELKRPQVLLGASTGNEAPDPSQGGEEL